MNKTIKLLLFFLFAVNMASALWSPLFSIFIIQHIVGASLALVGISTTIYALTKSSAQIGAARWLDTHAGEEDDFWAIFGGIMLASFCSFSFLFINKIWQLATIQVLWGLADALTMAAYYAIFSHHLDKKQAGFEWSLFSVGGITIAAALGGLIGGFTTQAYGFSLVFIAAGTLNLLSLLILCLLYPQMRIMRKSQE